MNYVYNVILVKDARIYLQVELERQEEEQTKILHLLVH